MRQVDIKELRKHLKSIGFNVKTESLSIGVNARITKGDRDMPSIFSNEDHRNQWLPAILLLQQEYADCTFTSQGVKVFGINNLKPGPPVIS